MTGAENLYVCKTYGEDKIRYLRCRTCQEEFSERKNTALWNTKIREAKAVSVAEHLSEGNSIKGTSRLLRLDPGTVRRINKRAGQHGKRFHDEKVQDRNQQADERHGFVGEKTRPSWEAELMDVESKFVLSHVQGVRDESLIRELLQDSVSRLASPQEIALFTDGDAKYASVFPETFGQAYRPARKGKQGRFPKPQYRIPHSLAHVQIIKHRQGMRLNELEIRYTHGSKAQVRKTLAFAKRQEEKPALGWWATTVYNWSRKHRSLREKLPVSLGKKSIDNEPPAMALGLVNSILLQAEILLTPVYPPQGWR